ncbi:MAG: PepSY domain-containing protein [Rhizomicrobium sp.]
MRIALRWIFAIHRYIGIGLGLLMLMWCLSGIVMMYVPYPSLSGAARQAGLQRLDLGQCCIVPSGGGPPSFSVEMIHGRLLLYGGKTLVDLRTGHEAGGITPADARASAERFARGNSLAATRMTLETIGSDQWTVSGGFRHDRPLYKFSLNDKAGTRLYVSSATGKVVQRVTASQRFWNYLGAVPHWLYFTRLRADPLLWGQVVIWTSLLGSFLVATGLYIGIRQWWVARGVGRWSPYRGFALWHHLPGLLFGVFLLSWIVSGLLSMNPWGLLEGDNRPDTGALRGPPATFARIGAALRAASNTERAADIVSLASAPLNGKLYLIATGRDGRRRRLDAAGQRAPLTQADIAFIAHAILHAPAARPSLVPDGDDYHFAQDGTGPSLPVLRLIAANGDRFYIDPVSGEPVAAFGAADRGYRWLFQGLHRLDFTAAMRTRPGWDVMMLVLLTGASSVAATGVYLGLRHIGRLMARRVDR